MFGDSRNGDRDSFANLVTDAIDASSLTQVAERWGVSEETIRGWRKGNSPRLSSVVAIAALADRSGGQGGHGWSDDERLRLLRLISRGRFLIEPLPEEEEATTEQTIRSFETALGLPHVIHGHTGAVQRKAQAVADTWHDALADGVIDAGERARLERVNDELIEATRRTRPRYIERWLGRIPVVGRLFATRQVSAQVPAIGPAAGIGGVRA